MDHFNRIADSLSYVAENFREQPSLAMLADRANMSEHHFQRVFSQWAGISPKKFLQMVTHEHALACLDASASILDTSVDAGLSGPSRLHDLFLSVDAMSPGEYKRRGKGLVLEYGFHDTHFGTVLLAHTERGLSGLQFVETGDQQVALESLVRRLPAAEYLHSQDATAGIAETLFNTETQREVRLLLAGSPFQLQVWRALLTIPEGECTTYSRLANAIKRQSAHRAVANAVGANPIGWLIPCHRVIRESGLLGGYRWGTGRKLALLGSERTAAVQ